MAVDNPKNQGIFHLLAILFIPAILVTFFLAENYWIGSILSVGLIIILIVILSKKGK